jgi:hypothetical protein
MSGSKMPETDQGGYHKYKSSIKLSSLEHRRPEVPPKVIPKVPPISNSSLYFPSKTASEERIIASYDEHQIRRTLEVEVSNDAVGIDEGTEGYKRDWNIVMNER